MVLISRYVEIARAQLPKGVKVTRLKVWPDLVPLLAEEASEYFTSASDEPTKEGAEQAERQIREGSYEILGLPVYVVEGPACDPAQYITFGTANAHRVVAMQ